MKWNLSLFLGAIFLSISFLVGGDVQLMAAGSESWGAGELLANAEENSKNVKNSGRATQNAEAEEDSTGYVDLGLSIRWATHNVGATRPEEEGSKFAWGETEEKELYDESTYEYYDTEADSLTKYGVDAKRELDAEDDAATVNMGENWRMPTQKEMQELMEKCQWVWTVKNGVCGCDVIGPNGNSIFMPATVKVPTYEPCSAPPKRIGVFSVSGDKKVSFSQGNLQCFPKIRMWKFADYQYDFWGESNVQDGGLCQFIDLFGWSADNTTAPFGISTSTNAADYAGKFVDWGNNWICGDAPGTWRTLGVDEWEYLFEKRDNASNLYGVAQVVGEKGLVVLPDNWVAPDGITFKAGLQSKEVNDYSLCQSFTPEQWVQMEEAGAVFLHASGFRDGLSVEKSEVSGYYWSSTPFDEDESYRMSFYSWFLDSKGVHSKYRGRSVRLVHDTIVPEYVDLGLSVKWATFNVGATSPEDYGDYFAWGEVTPKNNYSISTYKWCEGTITSLTKYCTNSHYGIVDNNGILDSEDDVATIYWKGDWRMPTNEEWTELRTNCTWTKMSINGVEGYRVTSKIEGYTDKSIFLPVAGYRSSKSIINKGLSGYYLSSSLYTGDPLNSWRLYFSSKSVSNTGRSSRWIGYSVRPVYGASTLRVPSVTTSAATQITSHSALVGGRVTDEGSSCVTEYGVVYSRSENPTVEDNKIVSNDGMGLYYLELSELDDTTTYYMRAYAINAFGVGYGKQMSFTTGSYNYQDTTGIVDGHAYVDLGLSVQWATCNLGADKPEDYGDYFAWGETTTKDKYNWSTYLWSNNDGTNLTKYVTNSVYGVVDNKTLLEPEDDAAIVNWGSSWRIPTYPEIVELYNKCIWVWTTENGVNGHRVTSTINGNSIFIPAAGVKSGKTLSYRGSFSYIATSSLAPSETRERYCLLVYVTQLTTSSYARYNGVTIRPVCSSRFVQKPSVTTYSVEKVTEHEAWVKGGVTKDGGDNIIEHGVVYSTSKNPTIADNKVISQDGLDEFICNLTGLSVETKYYVRAFATNSAGTSYGKQVTFTTINSKLSDPNGLVEGHAYVDLGLSVMWATCNVGAITSTEYGYYYSWGENKTKSDYSWDTYKWYNSVDSVLTKYCLHSRYGIVDNLVTLDSLDDAASLWGGDWRMPSDAEWIELRENCTWYWTCINGINGYKVVAQNGNSIFLPAAGCQLKDTVAQMDLYGYYWSNELNRNFSRYAQIVSFNNTYINNYYEGRFCGLSVRPVRPDNYEVVDKPSKRIGVFSVAEGKLVSFSQGNLQYIQSAGRWQFAPNQYEYMGEKHYRNGQMADTIEYFAWSGKNSNAPWGISLSIDDADYRGEFLDWGTNVISGDTAGTWRTLSNAEWLYVCQGRKNADKLLGLGTIENTTGLIILPDEWKLPENLIFTPNTNEAALNKYSLEEWAKMEEAGAVFVPTSGYFNHKLDNMRLVGADGFVRTSTLADDGRQIYAIIKSDSIVYSLSGNNNGNLFYAFSQRLVHDTILPVEPEYVDLGLSVNWATFNVGAERPEDYGDYFAWGETEPKEDYSWKEYKWSEGASTKMIKYNKTDGLTTLELEDDAAYVNWGDKWRMPSGEETNELIERCTWTWTTRNGVNGYEVTGLNGNSIFLPAGGYKGTGGPSYPVGEDGLYWLSDYNPNNLSAAQTLLIRERKVPTEANMGGTKRFGFMVRPVYDDIPKPCQVVKVNDTLAINMMCVEGGTFMMGASDDDEKAKSDEKPQHQVTITYDYKMMQTEVTQGMWEAVMGEDIYDLIAKSPYPDSNPGKVLGGTYPVSYVRLYQCLEFIDSLNARTGLHFRMPTEAEWEFAARGGNDSKGYLYAGSDDPSEVAVITYNFKSVASLKPNELGIYDMSGNIAEMVIDGSLVQSAPYPSAESQIDPRMIRQTGNRVVRNARPIGYDSVRVTQRIPYTPSWCGSWMGFRLVLPKEPDFRTFYVNGVYFDMIYVKGGTFMMGDDSNASTSPAHEVTLSDYYIGQVEVTQALWKAVMGDNPSANKNNAYPVGNVTYADCEAFVAKLSEVTGLKFRIPTEAEWEYAARGGVKSRGYKYSGSEDIDSVAWYDQNSSNKLHGMAGKKPNELGIYDMTGNAWEWCSDYYGKYVGEAQVNPIGPISGGGRVIRSGSFRTVAERCSNVYRQSRDDDYPDSHIGLRLVLED